MLSDAALQNFRRDGYYFPVPVLTPAEVAHYRGCLEKHEAKTGAPLQGNWRHKAHLLFTWVDELVHHPKIVDAAEDVLGPDLLCWTTNFFIKEANSPGFVSWHQDAFYWGLEQGRRHDGVGGAFARQSRERMHEIPARLADAGPYPARRHVPQGQPALARAGDRGEGGRCERRSTAFSSPARCRCITSSWCMARSPTAPTTGASAWPSATFRPT